MKTMKMSLALAGLMVVAAPFAAAQQINAAGATFPAVIYQKWFDEYHKMHADVEINYQSIGSGGGIAQLTKALANEWAGRGINVNALAPGYMATEMNSALIADAARYRGDMHHGPAKPGEQRRSVLDCGRAQRELHWQPQMPLADGVRATVEWFQKNE